MPTDSFRFIPPDRVFDLALAFSFSFRSFRITSVLVIASDLLKPFSCKRSIWFA